MRTAIGQAITGPNRSCSTNRSTRDFLLEELPIDRVLIGADLARRISHIFGNAKFAKIDN